MDFLIVDGLQKTRDEYRKLIESSVQNVQVFESNNAEDALFTLFDKGGDIIICSEVLSFRSSYELALLIKKIKPEIPIIVIANDKTNAIKAIKSNVFEYLIKPINPNEFKKSLINASEYVKTMSVLPNNAVQDKIKIRIGLTNGYKLVDINKLAYCMAEGAYTQLYYENGENDFSGYYLGKIEKKLENLNFSRINRSVLVNLRMVKQIDKRNETCEIEIGEQLKVFKMTKACLLKLQNDNIL